MENKTPELTFDMGEQAVATAEQVLDKQLSDEEIAKEMDKVKNHEFEHMPQLDGAELSPEDEQNIDAFVDQINLHDADNILLYGSAAQKKIADFSDSAILTIKNKDSGEVGDMLVDLIGKLKGFNDSTEKPKGIAGLFYNAKRQVENMKNKYETVEVNVEEIATELEKHQAALLKDIAMFDVMYETNANYFKELTMYIIAGQRKLKQERETTLKDLKEKAEKTGDALDAQKANDYAQLCDRFEKKLYDLELTRQVSLQMAPQIRLLQNNDSLLIERIQSTLSNTLPLWKSQMVIAMGLHRSQQALKAQTEVTNMTNELLRKNAAKLKTGTIETAKQSERGIIDIETLVETNRNLIDTISEVMKIQEEGHAKRVEAAKTLVEIENELKKKLVEIKG